MIVDRSIDPIGISGRRLNLHLAAALGSPTAAASNDMFTSQGNASFTTDIGTQPTAPRNLQYRASFSSTVAFASASGSLFVYGFDIYGNAVTESIAVSSLAANTSIVGTQIFASISVSGVSRGVLTLSSAAHAQSDNVSWYVGQHNFLGIPEYVSGSGAIDHVRVGVTPMAIVSSSQYTSGAYTNGVSWAAINVSAGTYASNKPVVAWYVANG